MIKEKVKQRFDNVSDSHIESIFQNEDIFPNNRKIITNTDEQIITLLNEFEDNGIPEKITNCGYNQEINTYKQGSTEAECCFNQKNTCSSKEWECPDNTYDNIDKSLETCLNLTDDNKCPDSEENHRLCCSQYQKCGDMNCPYGFINDYTKSQEYCEGPICNIENDSKCCKEKEKCKDLKCGYGRTNNRNRDDNYCKNEKCSIKYDLKTCCSRNEICSDMTCPLGYYNKKQNDNKSCFNEICDINNKLDVLKCCVECKPVENAKFYECNNIDGSYAVECNDGYVLEEKQCIKRKILLIFH